MTLPTYTGEIATLIEKKQEWADKLIKRFGQCEDWWLPDSQDRDLWEGACALRGEAERLKVFLTQLENL